MNERRITKGNINKELNNTDKELVEYIRLHLDIRDKDCERHMRLDITDCDIEFIVGKVRKYDAFVKSVEVD